MPLDKHIGDDASGDASENATTGTEDRVHYLDPQAEEVRRGMDAAENAAATSDGTQILGEIDNKAKLALAHKLVDAEDLKILRDYIALCNQAIDVNRDRFPYKQIFSSLDQRMENPVRVRLVNDCPASSYEVTLDDHNHCRVDCALSDNCGSDWKVSKSYLLKVLSDPEEHIANPAKLDWEWLML